MAINIQSFSIDMFAGQSLPVTFACTQDSTPINLTGCTVYFTLKYHDYDADASAISILSMTEGHVVLDSPNTASLVVQGIWSVLLLFSGTFDTLTDTLIFVSWIFYAAGAYGVFVLRRKMPTAPRPYRVPGYPVVPWVFVVFAALYLVFTVYNDIVGYQAAIAAGKPAIINSALGAVLVFVGTPIYFFYRRQRSQ